MAAPKRSVKPDQVFGYIDWLRTSGFCGRVQITLEFNKGGISRATVLKQDPELYRDRTGETDGS